MLNIQTFKTSHFFSLPRLKYLLAVFLALTTVILSSFLLPKTSYAFPLSFSCSVSSGINFPTPWPPTLAGSSSIVTAILEQIHHSEC